MRKLCLIKRLKLEKFCLINREFKLVLDKMVSEVDRCTSGKVAWYSKHVSAVKKVYDRGVLFDRGSYTHKHLICLSLCITV